MPGPGPTVGAAPSGTRGPPTRALLRCRDHGGSSREARRGGPAQTSRGRGPVPIGTQPGAEPGWSREVGAGPGPAAAAAARESGPGRRSGPGRHVAPLEAREGGQSIFPRPRVGGGGPARGGSAWPSAPELQARAPPGGSPLLPASPPPQPGAGRCLLAAGKSDPKLEPGEALSQLACLRSGEL